MPLLGIEENRKIFYTERRDAQEETETNQPVLVLIHGAGGTHLHWPVELRTLSSATVYALDLPGHGHSDPPSHSTIDSYAEDVVAAIDRLGLSNVVLMGHSMGGAIAQVIGWQKPTWLCGLILVGTSARLPVTDRILEGLLADFPRTVNFIMKMCWSGPTIQAVRIALAGREMRKIAPEVVHGDFVACNRFDIRQHLHEIGVPTLVVGASDDKMIPEKFSRLLAASIPNASFVLIPKAGHMMALEYPLQVTAVVERFLSERSGATSKTDQLKPV